MIKVSAVIHIPDDELRYSFTHSSGPGGQNVNKVSSAVYLRFDIHNSASLSESIKNRLIKLAGRRVSNRGILIIKAQRYRNQGKNRRDALGRFIKLVQAAAVEPVRRKRTKPPPAVKERRLAKKHRHSLLKQSRKPVEDVD